MAALCDGFTLCGLTSGPSIAEASILGIEQGKEADHVIVTDARKSITVYKVILMKEDGSTSAFTEPMHIITEMPVLQNMLSPHTHPLHKKKQL